MPAAFLRGGTSKGIFLNKKYLPEDTKEWDPIFRGMIGSPDASGRQLNGMGGGISSLSKICVVGLPDPPAGGKSSEVDSVDVEYTFIQVGVKDGVLDTSGNCGNLSTAIGVFALDEGICRVPSLESYGEHKYQGREEPDDGIKRCKATLKLLNKNTGKTIRTSFPVNKKTGLAVLGDPEIATPGVPGQHSRITLEILNPAGAGTGKLLPTGRPTDAVRLDGGGRIKISCVDAANPTIFLMLSKLNSLLLFREIEPLPVDPKLFLKSDFPADTLKVLEDIRKQAARMMGLDPDVQAQPKICILRPADTPTCPFDFAAKTLSMGVLHKAIPSTVALCLAAAVGTRGSEIHIAYNNIVTNGRNVGSEPQHGTGVNWQDVDVKIGIPAGIVGVNGKFEADGEVKSVTMERTARRLMRGEIYW